VKSISFFKNLLVDPKLSSLWRTVTSKQLCANLYHREMMKAEANRLIPRKVTTNSFNLVHHQAVAMPKLGMNWGSSVAQILPFVIEDVQPVKYKMCCAQVLEGHLVQFLVLGGNQNICRYCKYMFLHAASYHLVAYLVVF